MQNPDVSRPVRVAVFATVKQADKAVKDLLAAGFSPEEISVLCSNEHKESHFGDMAEGVDTASNTPAAIATGGVIGATIGGLALAASGVATGGASLLVAGTALVAGGALAGSFSGAMMTRGFEKEVADYYDQAVRIGKILVGVEVHGDQSEQRLAAAERVFNENGAEPVALVEG